MDRSNSGRRLTHAGLRGGIALPIASLIALSLSPGARADDWTPAGDIRFGYLASETRARDGATSSDDSLRMRMRLGVEGALGGGWHVGGRLAARLDSEQDDTEFWLRTHAPTPSGLEDGQGTIDQAYVEYRPDGSPWRLRLGRFQAAFGLADIMAKSLDQNDSSSFDITWTDGAWLQWRGREWTTHAIVRHNDRRGPTSTLRPPLDFSDSGSRASLFLAVESETPVGPLVHRMVTVTWLPDALRPWGTEGSGVEDYLAVTAKAAAQWPVGNGGTQFLLAGEVGYATNTPRRETMDSGIGDADALSWQASFNLMDIAPGHDVGIVYGRVADGWLLSSDFRPNDTLLEARWAWQASEAWTLDARLRRREEIDLPDGAGKRRDDDLYLRATWKF